MPLKNTIQNLLIDFDPNDPVYDENKFVGLPFELDSANIVFYPLPWDVTSSSRKGAANGPMNLLKHSLQIDLYDELVAKAWRLGHYFMPLDQEVSLKNLLITDMILDDECPRSEVLDEINNYSSLLHNKVYHNCLELMNFGKHLVLIGGDHSTAYGNIKACLELHPNMEVLQLDAHLDMRNSYEGYHYSHASIFYNVLEEMDLRKIFCLGIRDYSPFEHEYAESQGNRISVLTAKDLAYKQLEGLSFHRTIQDFFESMSNEVYISFDIDVLDLDLCTNTGTPVPGGLSYFQVLYIVEFLVRSGKKIVGMDICEIAGDGYQDGFTSAKLAYHLSNLMAYSQNVRPY